jgi:hypothetical protein
MKRQLIAFTAKPKMAKAEMAAEHNAGATQAVVLAYKPAAKRAAVRATKQPRTRHAVAAAR